MKATQNSILAMLLIVSMVACKQQSVESESEDNSNKTKDNTELQLVSERWKSEHRISDFHILKAELHPGVTERRVVELLGEPIFITQDDGIAYYEYIQGFKDNSIGWGAVISPDDKLIKWYQDPPQ